jgi:hypothetical protein
MQDIHPEAFDEQALSEHAYLEASERFLVDRTGLTWHVRLHTNPDDATVNLVTRTAVMSLITRQLERGTLLSMGG